MGSDFFNLEDMKIANEGNPNPEPAPVEIPVEVKEETVMVEETLPVEIEEEDSVETISETTDSPETILGELKDGSYHKALQPFAQFLNEKGFINLKDKEGNDIPINDFESLGNVLKESIDGNRYGDLNESQTRYLEALNEGVPLSEFEKNERAINSISSITKDTLLSDGQSTFNIIVNDLIAKGQDQGMAVKVANVMMKEDDRGTDAALQVLSLQKQSLIAKHSELVNSTKESNKIESEAVSKVLNDNKSILGIELTDTFKKKIQDNMLNRAGQTEGGIPLNAFDKWRHDNKAEAEVILNTLMVYTNGFKDLNNIKGTVKSNAVKELEKVLTSPSFIKENEGITVNNQTYKLV